MAADSGVFRGVVRGKVIELDEDTGWPDGQAVSVSLLPMLEPGEGIKRSAGAWADAGDELDRWLEETRQGRRRSRTEPTE